MEAMTPGYSMAELYAFVDNFNKKNKRSNIRKTHNMSLSDAQRILSQNLNAMSFVSETGMRREESQPVFTCTVAEKEEGEKPKSVTELLHSSLLTGSLTPTERLRKSQETLSQYGIPPPTYSFPYDIITDHHPVSPSLTALWRKMQASKTICRLAIPKAIPQKFVYEVQVPKYFLINPEHQFMDLKDLEWRYYKGIVKWSHKTSDSIVTLKYDSEKRFVESQDMPDLISPPLVCRSLVVHCQSDHQKT